MSNVRNYTDKELLDYVKGLSDFKYIPDNYWLLGVRSQEDESNVFDDKFYLFKGEKFISVTSGTTNKGDKGTAVMCEGWHYEVYRYGLHKQKYPALRQIKSIPYRRDYTKDGKTNPTTEIFTNIIYMNFHSASHDINQNIIKKNIGGWSEGCQVANNIPKYKVLIDLLKTNGKTTYCLIKEF
jgi:hypothetical protein